MLLDNRKLFLALAATISISALGCLAEEHVQVTDPAHAQNGERLILARRATISKDGFARLADQIGGQVMTFEEIVSNFPAANIPESVRAGLKFLKFNSMPDLLNVAFIGKMPTFDCTQGENLTEFRCGSTDVPLYYTRAFAKWNDDPVENAIPSELPYGYLRGDWPAVVAGPHATPEIYFSDVNVGFIPLDGSEFCAIGSSCLEKYGDKLAAWKAPGVFRGSQFYSGYCPAIQDPMGKMDNSLTSYVQAAPVVHDCQNDDGGDIGRLAAADEASYAYYSYHGGIGGSCPTGGYCYDYATAFGGIVYGLACYTGAPDLWPSSLAERQLLRTNGAIAYLGYARMADGRDVGDPTLRAFVAGRWTLGEAVSGYRQDIAITMPRQQWYRDLLSLSLYGPPSLPLAALPASGVKTIAAHVNGDGSITASVQAFGAGTHQLAIGDRGITPIDDGEIKEVAVAADEAKFLFRLTDCDTNSDICQAAQTMPEPKFRLDCNHPVENGNGTIRVDVTVPAGQDAANVTAEIMAVDTNCPDGINSICFLNSYGERHWRKMGSLAIPQLTAGTNGIEFAAQRPVAAGDHLRAIRIQLADENGSPIASCFVPLTEEEVARFQLD